MHNQMKLQENSFGHLSSGLTLRHLATVMRRARAGLVDRSRTIWNGEKGVGLVEVLIAVAILAIGITTYISAFSTSSIAIGKESRRVLAKTYAVSQLHHTRSQAYQIAPYAYPTTTPPSANFTATSNATAIEGKDDNIQKITVTVQFNGVTLSSLEEFKVNR